MLNEFLLRGRNIVVLPGLANRSSVSKAEGPVTLATLLS
jgi:hypothetical protein